MDKQSVITEAFRIIKNGAHFYVKKMHTFASQSFKMGAHQG